MREINLKLLVSALNEAKEETTFPACNVSEYVMEHIYKPLLRGERVAFSDLDFSAFDDDDLQALEHWLEEQDHRHSRLANLNLVFCEAVPVSAAARAFC